MCYTFRRAPRTGDAFRRAVYRVRVDRVSAVVCIFSQYGLLFFLVQLGPVLGTGISGKSRIPGNQEGMV